MNYYQYIRWSSKPQTAGDSGARQRELGAAWAQERGVGPLQIIEDRGVSGYSGKHRLQGSLSIFIDDMRRGRIPRGSTLLVESLDRLSREGELTALMQLIEIVQAGISVIDLDNKTVYDTMDGAQIRDAVDEAIRANLESKRKSKLSGRNWERKRSEAQKKEIMTTMLPVGYVVTGRQYGKRASGGIIELDPKYAPAVQALFSWVAEGVGLCECARRLQALAKPPRCHVPAWRLSTVRKILTNRAYVGELQPRRHREPDGPPIPDYYPRIIDDELFGKVQTIMRNRPKQGVPHSSEPGNLFTGVAKCSRCGNNVVAVYQSRRKRMVCTIARHLVHGERACPYASVLTDVLELSVLEALRSAQAITLWPDQVKRDDIGARVEAARSVVTTAKRQWTTYAKALMSLGDEAGASPLKGIEREARQAVEDAEQRLAEAQRALADDQAKSAGFDEAITYLQQIMPPLTSLLNTETVADSVEELRIGSVLNASPSPIEVARLIVRELWTDDERCAIKRQIKRVVESMTIDAEAQTWTIKLYGGGVLQGSTRMDDLLHQ